MPELIDNQPVKLNECVVLGSSGFPFISGESVAIAFDGLSVSGLSSTHVAEFSLLELESIGIDGPGTVTKGGGFIGGGFGVEGVVQGIAIAGILNVLTTSSKIHTFITLTTNFGELHLHYSKMEPGALRILLSDVFARLRRLDPKWTQSRKDLIHAHLKNGVISPEDAEPLYARLSAPPIWRNLKTEAEADLRIKEEVLMSGPRGLCPNCEKVIPLHSEECQFCSADFGERAVWSVTPVEY